MAVTTSAAWTISSVQGPRKLGDEVDADQDARLNGGRVDFGAGVPPTGLGTALIWGQVGATCQRHLRRPRRGCTGTGRPLHCCFISSSYTWRCSHGCTGDDRKEDALRLTALATSSAARGGTLRFN